MVISEPSFGSSWRPHVRDHPSTAFLSNSFRAELKGKTGSDPAWRRTSRRTLKPRISCRSHEFFDYLLPIRAEHKSYLSIGIGCTGGKHRSVYIAERLAELLKERSYPVRVSHRDATRQ